MWWELPGKNALIFALNFKANTVTYVCALYFDSAWTMYKIKATL